MQNLSINGLILSISGWRKIFAPDGEHGHGSMPSHSNLLLAAGMGLVWGNWLKDTLGCKPTVLVGMDTRPTGPALAEMIMRGLESTGCQVLFPGVTASPELMARSGRDKSVNAFACVTASHNPIGHNGLKFGTGGSVLGGPDAWTLIDCFKTLIDKNDATYVLEAAARVKDFTDVSMARSPDTHQKELCLHIYREFLTEIACGQQANREVLQSLRQGLQEHPVTIVADMNGSARAVSVDRDYLESLGAGFMSFNDTPGRIVHDILPEGPSLEPCCRTLEEQHRKNPSAILGYVPDNDGDRGNLVIWDEVAGRARPLEAQEVFALAALAELACMAWSENSDREASPLEAAQLVVNGPTSHRIRDIAGIYGAGVHEAEVGEVNVVNRAAQLRRAGYSVRLLGEGSNGGTIVHPAAVRDPLNTLSAILKLLRLPSAKAACGPKASSGLSPRISTQSQPFQDWLRRTGKESHAGPVGPAEVVAALPEFTTTPTSEPRAVMKIRTVDHAALKAVWEDLFLREWPSLAQRFGFADWVEINNEGTDSRQGMGPEFRSGLQRGGLKIVFRDTGGRDAGFIWMRGSGTEPVFRVMAEVRGKNPTAETALLDWHIKMVAEADETVCREHSASKNEEIPFSRH